MGSLPQASHNKLGEFWPNLLLVYVYVNQGVCKLPTSAVYLLYGLSLLLGCVSLIHSTDDLDQRIIKSGMENMERGTCVRFVPWTHQRDYLDIQPKSG